jgi:mono/diheme cytochrome c family protein
MSWQVVLAALASAAVAALVACAGPTTTTPTLASMAAKPPPDPAAVRRGEYLFTAAGCAGCHTDKAHGGTPLAGGKPIYTSFGAYYSRNITPDPVHGIGDWSDQDFLHALRQGASPDGIYYFPAFPFPSFTGMTDQDILDIYAYLRTQKPSPQENRPHDVPFPYDVRLSMPIWRLLYFEPGPLAPDPSQSAEWNRGAYLVNAVAHCGDCHTPRTTLGGLESDRRFNGNMLFGPGAKRAPNITADPTDGIGKWSVDDVASFLKTGITEDGDVVGAPMSEVVADTAKLTDADRRAIAVYVKSVPPLQGKGG